MQPSIYIGFDPREAAAFAVAKHSIRRHLNTPIPIHGLVLDDLRHKGLYRREMVRRGGQLWDVISEAPCSTEFSISRFLAPVIARARIAEPRAPAWALFVDGDMMALKNLSRLFDLANERFAVMCVKHQHEPLQTLKMDNQIQTIYPRKNWSSVTLWNLRHPANAALTTDLVNTLPGRDLHAFCWLSDDQIGEIPATWNWFANYGRPDDGDPGLVHFTEGTPDMHGYEDAPFAEEWRKELAAWAAGF